MPHIFVSRPERALVVVDGLHACVFQVTPENRKSDAQITKDVTRTMPNDEFIGSDQGREVRLNLTPSSREL